VKLDDGRVEQRVSESRAYTHAIILEVTPTEKAHGIASAERHLAERKAAVVALEPAAATAAAKAAHIEAEALDAYWRAPVTEGGRQIERWLTLSRGLYNIKTQADLDAHYVALREHLDHIPATDRDGRALHKLVAITPRLEAAKAADDYRALKAKRLYVEGFDISTGVIERKYGNPVAKLAAARGELASAEKSLKAAREAVTGPKSQAVYGWAQSTRNADNRVAAERAKRPLARVFHRESTVAAPASRKRV
jgi:hypothetical protein